MQCADMYLTFEVNTSKVKSSRHIEMNYENKKARAVGLAESIMNHCVILYNNFRSVVKVDKMCRLRDNFLFILGMLNSLGSQCNVMPSTIYRASFADYPLLVDKRKDEALNIIYDMFKVTVRVSCGYTDYYQGQCHSSRPTAASVIFMSILYKAL